MTTELVPWAHDVPERQRNRDLRKALRNGQPFDEASGKEAQRFGGSDTNTLLGPRENVLRSGFQPDAGLVIVSCEAGDIRQSANGLTIYDDDGQHEIPVEGVHDERMAELDEMYNAIMEGRPVHHDGRWGMATLEVRAGHDAVRTGAPGDSNDSPVPSLGVTLASLGVTLASPAVVAESLTLLA